MTISAFFLVLTAACCHATWNFCVKRVSGGPELVWLFSALSTVIYFPLAVIVVVTEKPVFGSMEIVFLAGSAALHLAYFLLLQQGYRRGDLSLVYPTARATGPLLATTVAVLVLGEHLSLQAAAGGCTIIFGVLNLTGGLRARARKAAISLAFGVSTGVLIASYTVWDAYAVAALAVPPLLLDYASNLARVVVLAPVAHRRKAVIAQQWRDHRLAILVIAVLSPLAYILVLYALTFTSVVYVAPTREISVLITVLLGSIVLGEGDLRRRFGWSVVIVGGVAVLATG